VNHIRLGVGLALAILLGGTGCVTLHDTKETRVALERWFLSRKKPPDANFSGMWNSTPWGPSYLQQTGPDVRGKIGTYRVRGIVEGRKAYLVFLRGERMEWSGVLDMPDLERLIGEVSRTIPFDPDNSRPLTLRRIYPK